MRILLVLALGLMVLSTQAQPPLSDSRIRCGLIGCWKSPRDIYEIQCNGTMTRTWPLFPVPATYTWTVQNGIFYQNGEPYEILAIDDQRIIYQQMSGRDAGRVYFLFRVFHPLTGGVI